MTNMKEFRKLVKSLPAGQRARLPEKIREVCNRPEHAEFIKAIALGAYLNLNCEISLIGYVTDLPEEISQDRQYCTAIKDEQNSAMIIGEDRIDSEMSITDFKNKVLFA